MTIYFLILILSIFLVFKIIYGIRKRKHIRDILKKGAEFLEKSRDVVIYYNHHGKFCSIDFAGDDIRQPYLMDEYGKEFTPFSDIEWELCPDSLLARSIVPSKAYRLIPIEVQIKHYGDGTVYYPITLQLHFRPIENAISKWIVTQVKRKSFTVEHPLMGILTLSKLPKQKIILGQKILLISRVRTYFSKRELWFDIVHQK